MKPSTVTYRIGFTLAGRSREDHTAIVILAKSDAHATRSAMIAIAALYGRESEEVFIHETQPMLAGTAVLTKEG